MHGSDLCLKVGVWGKGDLGRARDEESTAVGQVQTRGTRKEEKKEIINKNSSCMTEDVKNLEQDLGLIGPCSFIFRCQEGK